MRKIGILRPLPGAVLAATLTLGACAQVQDTMQGAADGIERIFGAEPGRRAEAPDAQESPDGGRAEASEALYRGALAARARGAEDEALRGFRAAAERGHGPAAYEVGGAYMDGRGVAPDRAEALRWMEAAASWGEPRAQFVLGEAHAIGRGVPKNAAWAARWYGKAAEQGLAPAQYAYGVAHARGLGLPVNRTEGYAWLLLAARGGHERADVVRRAIAPKMAPEMIQRAEARASRFRAVGERPFADPPTVMYVQQALNALGYEAGPVDGRPGRRTLGAVSHFQKKNGLPRDGRISPDLVDRLLAEQTEAP